MPEQFQKEMVIVVSYNLCRTSIGDRIFFNSIIDKRYKTNRVSVNLILPLERDKVSVRALIPNILRKGYRECPDFTEFSKKLAMLYGSYIGYDVTAIGDSQVMTLSAGVIDDMYALDGEHLLSEISEILAKVVLDPVLENGLFPEKEAALEKQSLIDLIESEMNEKRHYALNRATAVLCAGEPAGVNKYGYVEDVKKIPEFFPQFIVHSDDYWIAKMECRKCGEQFHIHPYALFLGLGCPKCDRRADPDEIFQRQLHMLGDGAYTLEEHFLGYGKNVKIRHETCGAERNVMSSTLIWMEKKCACENNRNYSVPS